MTAGSSRSQPSSESVAVWSTNRRPSIGSSSHHRAVRIRRMWPWANTATSPSAARARSITRSTRTGRLLEGLAAGAGMGPDGPAGHRLADRRGGDALVGAVVELAEVVVDLGLVGQADELAGVACPLQRAR